jgi:hypothetical protein
MAQMHGAGFAQQAWAIRRRLAVVGITDLTAWRQAAAPGRRASCAVTTTG